MASLKEQRAYKAFQDASVGVLNVKRVENQVGDGMSDIVAQSHYGFDIWLEVKALEELPKRATTAVLRGEFRPGQLPFLREKISWGGHGFALLRVGRDWFLLDPTADPEAITKAELTTKAIAYGSVAMIVNYLENLKHEDQPYGSPNYRPGTKRRKEEFRIPDGTGHGQDVDNAG